MIRLRTALLILGAVTLMGCIYTWTAWPYYHGLWVGHMIIDGKENLDASVKIKHRGGSHIFIDYAVVTDADTGPHIKKLFGDISSTQCRYDIPDKPLEHPERKVSYRFAESLDSKTCGQMFLQFDDYETLSVQLKGGAILKLKRRVARDPVLNHFQRARYAEAYGQVPKYFSRR